MEQPVFSLLSVLKSVPQAVAFLTGSDGYPSITGEVRFYRTRAGVVVYAQFEGLPEGRIFGFHIHEGTVCSGNETDPFADARSHYNPGNHPHPSHAGDLPPLFSCHGLALSLFLTDRFTVDEVMGKAMILHDRPDDFTTQPSGNSGAKIACGIIRPTARSAIRTARRR